MPQYAPDLDATGGVYAHLKGWGGSLVHADGGAKEDMVEHRCAPSDWMQGAIGIVCLPDGQGQLGGGWHLVFWQSETQWDRSLAIAFCPYCGLDLERATGGRALGTRIKRLLLKLLPKLP